MFVLLHRGRSLTPQFGSGNARPLDQRFELGPHDGRVNAMDEWALGEATIRAPDPLRRRVPNRSIFTGICNEDCGAVLV